MAGKVVEGEPEQGINGLRGVARFGKDIGSRKRNGTAEDRWCDRVAEGKSYVRRPDFRVCADMSSCVIWQCFIFFT